MKNLLISTLVVLLSTIGFAQSPVTGVSSGTGASASQTQGAAATGAAVAGNPVLVGGKDGSGNAQPIATDTSGRQSVVGAVAANASGAGVSPVAIAAWQTPNGTVQDFICANSGGTQCGFWQTVAGADGVSNASFGTAYNAGNGGAYPAVATVGNVFNGATWDRQFYCSKVAKLNALAAATTQIVALAASQKIRVCNMSVSNNNATATTLKMVEGTGANCATGQSDVTSLWNIGGTTTSPIFMHWGNDGAIITTTAADALCFTSNAASSLEITITYDQH